VRWKKRAHTYLARLVGDTAEPERELAN
jgi:hypothetical protein